ncbi:MAG TPA: hypothetical protein VH598_15200, partial [Verrucomicrobiae bacterium]|nr:hypothetical protein [Verrucomicrobiae bacterium]
MRTWLWGIVVAVGLVARQFGTPALAQVPLAAPAAALISQESNHLAQLGSRGIRIHDPSTIVKCGDEYWVFYTGRGVPSYHSKDLVNWQPGPR